MNFAVTNHAVLRYAQRENTEILERVTHLIDNIHIIGNRNNLKGYKRMLKKRVRVAQEDKSVFNNINKMIDIYERYGYDNRYRFFKDDKMTYVGIEIEDKILIVTCMPLTFTQKQRRIKYTKKHINKK